MKKQLVWRLAAFLIISLFLSGPLMAQGKGHTGGLGEVRIPLNYASAKNLAKAQGLNEELAEAIVKYREEVGYFFEPEDLLKVPGITQEIYEKINPQVGTEGDIYTLPRPGEELDEEDMDIPLAPSKC